MESFWNQRYAAEEYAYGKEPNAYFRSVIDSLKPGKLLVPGAGEGRDAVYAASLGWKVEAFDSSEMGRKKALLLAKEKGVSLEYPVMNARDYSGNGKYFNLIALIFFHVPAEWRNIFHRQMVEALSPGGMLVLEAFTPRQLLHASGGPKEPSLLMTPSLLAEDFRDLQILECRELETVLHEGPFHEGKASVVRFLGKKKELTPILLH